MSVFQKSSQAVFLIFFVTMISLFVFSQPSNGKVIKKNIPTKKPFSQLMEKDTLMVRIADPYASFSSAIGWIRNMDGKWVSAKNKIPHFNPEFNVEYYEDFEIGTENFQKIELSKISLLGKTYDAIFITALKSYSNNEVNNKQKDSLNLSKIFSSIEYYILDAGELNKLKKFVINGKNQSVSMKFTYYGYFGYKSPFQMKSIMKNYIEQNIIHDHQKDPNVQQYFQFVISPKKQKNGSLASRFYYGNSFGNKNDEAPPADFSVFDRQYYTISAMDWNGFVLKGR